MTNGDFIVVQLRKRDLRLVGANLFTYARAEQAQFWFTCRARNMRRIGTRGSNRASWNGTALVRVRRHEARLLAHVLIERCSNVADAFKARGGDADMEAELIVACLRVGAMFGVAQDRRWKRRCFSERQILEQMHAAARMHDNTPQGRDRSYLHLLGSSKPDA